MYSAGEIARRSRARIGARDVTATCTSIPL